MPVKIEMNFKETLEYLLELKAMGKENKFEDVRQLLETDLNNTETRLKNAELELRGRREPLAVGSTVEECLYNFAVSQKWLKKSDAHLYNSPGDDVFKLGLPYYLQGYDFSTYFFAGGNHYKGAGRKVPGGFILTWYTTHTKVEEEK